MRSGSDVALTGRRYALFVLWAALLAVTLDVPFVPQVEDTCGPAALAMVLRFWQRPASHETLAAELAARELKGVAGSRLAEAARSRGLTAVAYRGDARQLREYVDKGRPLIVAWDMGRRRFHNVVVVGFDGDDVVVHDPARGASQVVKQDAFEKRWAGADHWTLLVMPAAP